MILAPKIPIPIPLLLENMSENNNMSNLEEVQRIENYSQSFKTQINVVVSVTTFVEIMFGRELEHNVALIST